MTQTVTTVPQYDPLPPRRPFWVAPLVTLVILGLGALATVRIGRWAGDWVAPEPTIAVEAGIPVTVDIPSGYTARGIGRILEDNGVISSAQAFVDEVSVRELSSELKAGRYELLTGMPIDDALSEIVKGPFVGEVFRVTVVEGLWVDEVIASLARQTEFTEAELTDALTSSRIRSAYMPDQFSGEELSHWEGLLFPDTYEFFADVTAETVVGTLVTTLDTRVAAVDWSALEEVGIVDDPNTTFDEQAYQGLIIASLIEAEAKLDADRPTISSVIYNRLEIGQGLNIDATLVYAKGARGVPTGADRDIDSPYNTYRFPGLPPTPISAVRRLSLEAAANPEDTNFYYYVVVDVDGRHGFSTTLEEHNAKVAKARAEGVI